MDNNVIAIAVIANLSFLCGQANAQNKNASTLNDSVVKTTESDPLQPITHLFDAMREHNGKKFLLQFSEKAILQRVKQDGSIQTSKLKQFAESIASSTNSLDEQLLSVSLHKQGSLASVWTPYIFYLDGKVSHCGHNSFQLVKFAGEWKIQYLIDNVFDGDCDDFSQRFKVK